MIFTTQHRQRIMFKQIQTQWHEGHCAIMHVCGLSWFLYFTVGKPVDSCDNVDYVPTLFSYHKQLEKDKTRREDLQRRIDKRRKLSEVADGDKENRRMAEKSKKESQEMATKGLLHLQNSFKVDAENQTTSLERKIEGTLVSGYTPITTPTICYRLIDLNAASSKLIEGNDESTRFYTGFSSSSLFQHLITFLSTYHPNLIFYSSRFSPSHSLLIHPHETKTEPPYGKSFLLFQYCSNNCR